MSATLLVMAGGTGGHIFPALAVAKALMDKDWKIVWLGAIGAMETRLVPEHNPRIIFETLNITGVRGTGLSRWMKLPWVQGRAVCKALKIILHYQPDVVIGFGGFTSFAGGIAAKLLRRPLVIHEQNAVAGLTNRILAKMANQVLFAFPAAFPRREGLVGNPIRMDLLHLPLPETRFKGRSGPLKIVVVGGSLGAAVLNSTVPKALALLDDNDRPQVLHQAGTKHIEQLEKNYQLANVSAQCVPFIADMATALMDADLIICRSGALTIAELAAVGVAAVMVPFAAAVDDHQTGNARYLSDAGAGILIAQTDFTPQRLAQQLTVLSRADLLTMAKKARQLAKPDATQAVVNRIETLLKIA